MVDSLAAKIGIGEAARRDPVGVRVRPPSQKTRQNNSLSPQRSVTQRRQAPAHGRERPFRARRGGSPQRFCGSKCRMMFWSALRRWGEQAVAAGILTIGDIRSGSPAACTLHPGRVSPAPVSGEASLSIPRLWRLARIAPTRDRELSSSSWHGRSRRVVAEFYRPVPVIRSSQLSPWNDARPLCNFSNYLEFC
jgi:hypothetical protein